MRATRCVPSRVETNTIPGAGPVAATQFTAYMAMMNLCISYTAWWQGFAIERIGYPATLLVDSLLGLVALLLLPLMAPRRRSP